MANLKYHHLGIPTKEKHADETFLEKFKTYVSGYETSQYKIEWMRFEEDAPVPSIVKTVPHVAFEVDNFEEALMGKEILIEPNSPSPGVMVAFIIENGAPIELIKIDRTIAKDY